MSDFDYEGIGESVVAVLRAMGLGPGCEFDVSPSDRTGS
jgi:hypothetical protein